MQCCGEPFLVGDLVSWPLAAAADRDFIESVLGPEQAALVTDAEDHHEAESVRHEPLVGRVSSIEAVFCAYAPSSPEATEMYPVLGSAVVERRERADGWEADKPDNKVFLSYLVDVEEGSPPSP